MSKFLTLLTELKQADTYDIRMAVYLKWHPVQIDLGYKVTTVWDVPDEKEIHIDVLPFKTDWNALMRVYNAVSSEYSSKYGEVSVIIKKDRCEIWSHQGYEIVIINGISTIDATFKALGYYVTQVMNHKNKQNENS